MAHLLRIFDFLIESTPFKQMKVLQFFWTIKSLRRFSAPYSLIHIFRLGYGMLGLTITTVTIEIVFSLVSIKALDQLLPSLGRLTEKVSLSRLFRESKEGRAFLVTICLVCLTNHEAGIMARHGCTIHVFRVFIPTYRIHCVKIKRLSKTRHLGIVSRAYAVLMLDKTLFNQTHVIINEFLKLFWQNGTLVQFLKFDERSFWTSNFSVSTFFISHLFESFNGICPIQDI